MAVNAVIGTHEFPTPDETIFTGHHSPVVKTKKVKTGQGVLEAGLIVALDASGEVVPYDPSATDSTNQPIGVLIERCDTDKEDAAAVLVHGTVWRERLLVGSSAPGADDLKKLEDIGIWAMP